MSCVSQLNHDRLVDKHKNKQKEMNHNKSMVIWNLISILFGWLIIDNYWVFDINWIIAYENIKVPDNWPKPKLKVLN